MRCIIAGLAAACLTYAQQPSVLPQIQARMIENLSRLPNYTCAQTTVRSVRRGSNRPFELMDTLRLEVALVEGKELFGWPGSNRITESDLTKLIGTGGALGNGNFGLLAKGVFLSRSTAFTFKGETVRDGHRALQFDYKVPQPASGYHLKVDRNDAVVGYHGSFWANAETLDLTRLEIYADNIPADLGLAAVSDAMDYARVTIGESDFLLPKSAELNMASASGLADHNRTRFHECHQYAGESVLSFIEAPESVPDAVVAPPAEIALPDDFQVGVRLETPVTTESAIGDVVQVKLLDTIKDHHERVVAKGAILSGHIALLHRDGSWYHVGISFTDMNGEEGHADVSRRFNALFAGAGARDLHLGATQLGFHGKKVLGAGEFAINGDRPLNLRTGYRITLRSRLLQSGR